MFNLLRAELFRYYKSVSFKVMLIIVASVSILTMLIMTIPSIIFNDEVRSLSKIFTQTVSGGTFILVSIAFVAVFCNADRKCGALKNVASRINRKEYLALSKFIIVVLIYAVIFFESYLFLLISGKILLGRSLYISFTSEDIGVLAIQFLLHVAFGTIIMMLTVMARNTSVPITIGLVSSAGLLSLIYMLINLILLKLSSSKEMKFDIMDYSLTNNIKSLSAMSTTSEQIRTLIVGVVYLVIGLTVSMLIYKKQDI